MTDCHIEDSTCLIKRENMKNKFKEVSFIGIQ